MVVGFFPRGRAEPAPPSNQVRVCTFVISVFIKKKADKLGILFPIISISNFPKSQSKFGKTLFGQPDSHFDATAERRGLVW
jgi:hypothetical protein